MRFVDIDEASSNGVDNILNSLKSKKDNSDMLGGKKPQPDEDVSQQKEEKIKGASFFKRVGSEYKRAVEINKVKKAFETWLADTRRKKTLQNLIIFLKGQFPEELVDAVIKDIKGMKFDDESDNDINSSDDTSDNQPDDKPIDRKEIFAKLKEITNLDHSVLTPLLKKLLLTPVKDRKSLFDQYFGDDPIRLVNEQVKTIHNEVMTVDLGTKKSNNLTVFLKKIDLFTNYKDELLNRHKQVLINNYEDLDKLFELFDSKTKKKFIDTFYKLPNTSELMLESLLLENQQKMINKFLDLLYTKFIEVKNFKKNNNVGSDDEEPIKKTNNSSTNNSTSNNLNKIVQVITDEIQDSGYKFNYIELQRLSNVSLKDVGTLSKAQQELLSMIAIQLLKKVY